MRDRGHLAAGPDLMTERVVEMRSAIARLSRNQSDAPYPPVLISRPLYLAGLRAGLDMRNYEILKPIPIGDCRISIYRRVELGDGDTLHPDQHFTGER